MDSGSFGRAALMSIHPDYADAILRGEKRVEFRKKPLAHDVTHIIVYATRPVSAIVGAFEVTGQDTASPASLWHRYGDVGWIEHGKFYKYFRTCDQGTGIHIGGVFTARPGIGIKWALGGDKKPPQSFQYIDQHTAMRILRKLTSAPWEPLITMRSLPL